MMSLSLPAKLKKRLMKRTKRLKLQTSLMHLLRTKIRIKTKLPQPSVQER